MSTSASLRRTVTLASGVKMPLIGFGTFQTEKPAILAALKAGYRHLDTAYSYGTEEAVGRAIVESKIPRGEIFITTKLAQTFHQPEHVEIAVDKSLESLGFEGQDRYIDLFLMHFPHAYVPEDPDNDNFDTKRHTEPGRTDKPVIDSAMSRDYLQTWQAMERLVDIGKVRAIGLSNFSILKTKKILEGARIQPDVNQIELHPYLPQRKLVQFSKENNIHITAHSPLGGAPSGVVAPYAGIKEGPLKDPVVLTLAEKYAVEPSTILLSWAIQRGTSIVPKSNKEDRIVLNTKTVELSQEDFDRLENLKPDGEELRFNDPLRHIGFDIYNEDKDEYEPRDL